MLLDDKNFAYINFDDERLVPFNTNQIVSSFYDIYGKNFEFVFLDEIQNLEHWELFVNRLHRSGLNVFITGSNSNLLSKELATHLTGRHMTIELFPFSFMEYLRAKDFTEDIKTTKGISSIQHELNSYIELGGFPEIIVEKENPKIYTRELYKNIIERDVINRYNITYKKTFKEIAMNILRNPARLISYNKIKKHFNLGSEHTVKNYLSYLEETYLVFLVNKFSHKPVEIEKSEKKTYIIDSGIINILSTKFSKEYGHIYENIVAVELLRQKSFNPDLKIYYWKNAQQEEIDFVIKNGVKIESLIQVCYNIEDIKTKERKIRILIKASKELKCNNLLMITEEYEAEEEINWFKTKRKIQYVPLWKWLLKDY